MRNYLKILSVAGFIMAGCATGPIDQARSERAPGQGLPPQKLAPGQCGLFVWTADQPRYLLLFSDQLSGEARWYDQGVIDNLTIGAGAGERVFGQFTEQTYRTDDGRDLTLTLIDGEEMDLGMRFARATLKFSDAEGWSKVKPVSAIATCQSPGAN